MALTGQDRHYKYSYIEFWAENGMVKMVDTRAAADSDTASSAVRTLRPGEFLQRVLAVAQATPDQYPDEMRNVRKLLEEGTRVAKIARSQGDPLDPKVREHRRKHERKTQLFIPGQPRGYKLHVKGRPEEVLYDGTFAVVPQY